jgi:pimeloyl-ACP methyl ester carboxylesterase
MPMAVRMSVPLSSLDRVGADATLAAVAEAPVRLWWEARNGRRRWGELPGAAALDAGPLDAGPLDGAPLDGGSGAAGEACGPWRPAACVLLPDAHRSAAAWPAALLDGLSAAGHRLVLLDLRDQGRSPWLTGEGAPYGIAEVAGDVCAVLGEAIGDGDGDGPPPLLLGHGFGASVALEVAVSRPDLVGGMVLVGGTGWFVDPSLPGPEEPVVVGLIWRRRLATGSSGGGRETSGRLGEGGVRGTPPAPRASPRTAGAPASGPAAGPISPTLLRAVAREHRLLAGPGDDPGVHGARAEVERWLAWGFNPDDGHGRAWLTAPSRWSVVAARRHPVRVVHGAADPLVPLAHGRRLAAESGSEPRIVAEAGHALSPLVVRAVLAAVADLTVPR